MAARLRVLRVMLVLCMSISAFSAWADDDDYDPAPPGDPQASFAVTTTASPAQGAVLSGSGLFMPGAKTQIVCKPNPGYDFVRWTINGFSFTTEKSFLYTVSDTSANFVAVLQEQPKYALSLGSNFPEGAALTGDGNYYAGQSVLVKCVLNPNYSFVRWSNGGVEVSTIRSFYYDMPAAATTLTAELKYVPKVTVTIAPDDALAGTVNTTGGSYVAGDQIAISTSPKAGYVFSHWLLNGAYHTDQQAFDYTVTAVNAAFVAVYDYVPSVPDDPFASLYSQLFLQADPAGKVTFNIVSGTQYQEGASVALKATMAKNYAFEGWYLDDVLLSSNASYSYTMPDHAVTLVARATYVDPGPKVGDTKEEDGITYEWDGEKWVAQTPPDDGDYDPEPPSDPFLTLSLLTVSSDDVLKGTVAGSGYYDTGSKVTITATPAAKYRFDHWDDGSTDNPRTITLSEDTERTAYFVRNSMISVTISSDCSVTKDDD